tara:strand:+ start:776 stop:955 length:180 start_codon:yes stop_codon:yes gene_type:complete
MLGWGEWIAIILVIIVLFGGKKIPELARGLGKGINEFKRAKDEIKEEIESDSENKDESK